MSANGSGESSTNAGRERANEGLHAAARTAVVVGGVGSIACMLRVGHRSDASIPTLLLVLFTGWVLSPFVALVLADVISTRWSVRARNTLHALMLILAVGSLAIYGSVAFSPPRPKPAALFLLVPLGSWVLMAIVFAMGAASRPRDT